MSMKNFQRKRKNEKYRRRQEASIYEKFFEKKKRWRQKRNVKLLRILLTNISIR